MSGAEVMAPVQTAPVVVADAPAADPVDVPVDDEEDEEEVLVFKARGKRVRPAAGAKSGDDAEDDTSPRGPIDASQADSPPNQSSDDEAGDHDATDTGLPGKKKLKLRTKGAAEAAAATGAARKTDGDSELEEDEELDDDGFYGYDEDDEEAALEARMRETGTLSGDEAEDGAAGADEGSESEESEMEDSDEDDDLDATFARDDARRAKASKNAKKQAAPEPIPENETDAQKETRMAREKKETAAMQQEIMREASKRARLSGYHVAPDRDPFAYRKIFATVAARVAALQLPEPPVEQVFEDEVECDDDDDMDDGVSGDELSDEEEDYEFDDAPKKTSDKKAAAKTVELALDDDLDLDADDLDDDLADLDGVAGIVAAVKAKQAAGTLDISAEAAAKERAAQVALEAEDDAPVGEPDDEDDLSEEETREMTRSERLRQLKRAKAFFKADAVARKKHKAGGAFEDEAEMSEDGGHTSDEEEVEIEEEAGADGRVIKRRVAKRADGLLDREELEEMVDYIDFENGEDDDERRVAKRAAAHAKFETERDDEEIRKMKQALENGFRRKETNAGALDGGPDGWQRRRRANSGEDESDEEDLGIDIPDRAWEHVELSSDDDGEWAERAARRKAAVAAADSQPANDDDSQTLASARDVGFDSQDFRSMIDAGKQRRRQRTRVGVDAAALAMEQHATGSVPGGRFPTSLTGAAPHRANSTASLHLERQASTSFLGRGNGSKSAMATSTGAGLVRTASIGGGGASRSFVFGASGDSQSMWDKDAEERATGSSDKPATVLRELGGDENARSDFGWAPREKMAAPASKPKGSRLGAGSGSQSLFGMLQASQDWDEVLGKSDSLAQGVKAAKSVKLRAVPR
jgi:hypothetical protein